ncbi:MAG: ribonuclease HII [Candidatus Promineifilaceae bacterium]|nr:ribonuclease HII [Candidatus Promineifilaceae bacterium]
MPTLDLEEAIRRESGARHIAGLDEAGRGAVAGPVVAAAVILPLDDPQRLAALAAVDDSKQLTPARREILYDLIIEHALAYAVGLVRASQIDRIGILPANAHAMQSALSRLEPGGDYLLLDGRMRLPRVPLPQRSVIRGDSLSLSIAAASILAKVTRDRHMVEQDNHYPQYGFARHKGYCTAAHVAALEQHGPCAIHRHTFAPIRPSLLGS